MIFVGSLLLDLVISTETEFKKASPRIIEGNLSRGYPWLSAIWDSTTGVHCGGALIHEEWILTAAHCVIGDPDYNDQSIETEDQFVNTLLYDRLVNGPMHVKIGAVKQSDITNDLDHIITRPIKSAHCHPDFNKHSTNAVDNDICLLRLDNEVSENDVDNFPFSYLFAQHQLCLPSFQALENQNCVVAGWGLTEDGGDDKSNELLETILPKVSIYQCGEWYAENNVNIDEDFHLCFGYEDGRTDACRGDSGGPIMCKNDENQWEAHGIVSFAIGCGLVENPGVYANVDTYTPWILETINSVSPEANFSATCSGSMSSIFLPLLLIIKLLL